MACQGHHAHMKEERLLPTLPFENGSPDGFELVAPGSRFGPSQELFQGDGAPPDRARLLLGGPGSRVGVAAGADDDGVDAGHLDRGLAEEKSSLDRGRGPAVG